MDFRINPALDTNALRANFAAQGRVHIANFLEPQVADALYEDLRHRADWRLVINQGDKLFELDREAQGALNETGRRQLDNAVYGAARDQFQFRYETIRVPDEERARAASDDALAQFATFMSTDALSFLREVTGQPDVVFADAQGTAYSPGHFLTAHDDEVAGKHRLAAYVYNLTPHWRADWGGLLLFHGADGHVERGFVPAFNALNIFSVPQPHSVSLVTPSAAYRRYAVTGWLRARG